ncbi:MAG: hypothetical protein IPP38_10190 [Bacteroidetes bacterium]|nr:hypothetical protein [Bacteroidota bacterium]
MTLIRRDPITATGQERTTHLRRTGKSPSTVTLTATELATGSYHAGNYRRASKNPLSIPELRKQFVGTRILNLSATVSNGSSPILYNWGGPGIFSRPTCSTTTLSGVPPGGPYSVTIGYIDLIGCTADTTVDVTVNPKLPHQRGA